MTGDRRKFRREGEERRREALISAAMELVAEGGVAAATVRAIAERAGVTPGLIRHYFQSKEELARAAYVEVMSRMTTTSITAAPIEGSPVERLRAYVLASMRPPIADAEALGLWAGFIHMVRRDPEMREIHRATYLDYRDRLQTLIAALPREASAEQLRADAIACNGVIDGLWLEGSAIPESFRAQELETIALKAVGAILGIDLNGETP